MGQPQQASVRGGTGSIQLCLSISTGVLVLIVGVVAIIGRCGCKAFKLQYACLLLFRAVQRFQGFRPAVRHLLETKPVIFDGRGESTVRNWYVPGSYTELTIQAKKYIRS